MLGNAEGICLRSVILDVFSFFLQRFSDEHIVPPMVSKALVKEVL
jgi:hypothetical protein